MIALNGCSNMIKYRVGHYYKRTYKNKKNYFVIFKPTEIFRHGDFMFITMLRCGNIRSEYDCSFKIKRSGSKTVELSDMELTTLLL